MALHRDLFALRELLDGQTEWRRADAFGDIGDVRDDGGSRCLAARARADQRQFVHGVGIDRHRIGDAHHFGERRGFMHHGRVHALLDALARALRDAKQLDPKAEILGRLDIGERHALNAFDMYRVRIDSRAERKRRQDRKLMRGVEAADIEARIGLGITQPLRFLQALLERQLLSLHARQNVIAGAVQDAVDALDRISRETFAQGLDDRDSSRDRGLEGERDVLLLCESCQRDAVLGEQRLVGGDDVLARRKRRFDRGACRPFVATHQLHKQVDLRRARERDGVVEHRELIEIDGALLARIAHGARRHMNAATGPRSQRIGLPLEQAVGRAADNAEAGDPDAQGFDHSGA